MNDHGVPTHPDVGAVAAVDGDALGDEAPHLARKLVVLRQLRPPTFVVVAAQIRLHHRHPGKSYHLTFNISNGFSVSRKEILESFFSFS